MANHHRVSESAAALQNG